MNRDFAEFKYRNLQPRRMLLLRLVWELVWLLAFRPTPRWALHGWRRTLLRLFGAKIGPGCRIAPTCFVWAPWNLEMGTLSVLGDHVDCYSMNRIRIGSKVAVSQRSFLCTGSHDINSLSRPLVTEPIDIGDHVWIAAESMVMPGVSIGEGVVVGARSLVTKDLPPWTVCAGNPCRPIRQREIGPAEVPGISPPAAQED
ncbi:putative colanic acid biosynthesis acetyltransferase [Altererythrobacter sp. CC-YST694]|uniref:putative colanic acid biosynthesis acetyltransferase n=1 Tax=Altererythrobacter sp. CC-YST694 TaxID=2755038 RepID=UPI001D01A612|nr:putative colanic acid biosynthesis acetyltransferase [Altererythrobacter sp. CC-YST694]MCB5425825.1 putative colanic acid biosynthesis acetyltransferase [Altererythrobacter sp. CC-YST694]